MDFLTSSSVELVKRKFFDGDTPSLASGVAFTAVFSVFSLINALSCSIYHQWWFFGTWGVGLVLEIIGYSGRIWYTINDNNGNAYIMELVCITVAPCFLMAGIYYILAQLVLIYGNQFSYMKPMHYSLTFIICDVVSICLQGAGGGISSSANSSSVSLGSNIMIAGLAFQVATITIYQYLWYAFLWKIYQSHKNYGGAEFNPKFEHVRARKYMVPFMVSVCFAVIFVYVRSIYRLIETSCGWGSTIAKKEIYFNILEGLMISLAALLMAIFSPGFVYGKDAHLHMSKSLSQHVVDQDIEDEIEAESKENLVKNGSYDRYQL